MKNNNWSINQGMNIVLGVIFILAILLSAYTMAAIAFPYLVPPFPTDIDFLESKQWVVDEWHWLAAFYIHITSAVLVLAAGLTQFSKTLMFKYPQWHRVIGKIYVFLVLVVAGPSGFVMAFYGNGGFWARCAFVAQAVFWWWLTYKAYQTIKQKKLRKHGKYMLRSYAMTLSAISLRGATYIVSAWKMKHGIFCPNATYQLLCYPDFYILVAWLSWIVNLMVAEFLIVLGIMNYYFPKEAQKDK
ncbi:DUF2306 domain-containing protein [Aureispira anguillae]|uniref:DUF2306 domain-containing protein n=1 Tax=Aureispira anguillae TaxID=2864201 RepID=A0A915YKW9_9BACT|nr:DUF2306 domain-containing protein [Aureispira anguillae]BDS14970.1 DUF2306 domain-containing protein [Aureispira anguillae]